MKFCVDCEFARKCGSLLEKGWYCFGPHIPLDPVTGKRHGMRCEMQRLYRTDDRCGPEGKHWRPKKTPEKYDWLMWWW